MAPTCCTQSPSRLHLQWLPSFGLARALLDCSFRHWYVPFQQSNGLSTFRPLTINNPCQFQVMAPTPGGGAMMSGRTARLLTLLDTAHTRDGCIIQDSAMHRLPWISFYSALSCCSHSRAVITNLRKQCRAGSFEVRNNPLNFRIAAKVLPYHCHPLLLTGTADYTEDAICPFSLIVYPSASGTGSNICMSTNITISLNVKL